ncbi:hypothetical protein FP73_gp036 [Bacillus phage Hoody T]|uniref:Uncharacterized protein n=1 Tax=Bacillus phage Hoody T TaxID=1486660 RepID=A0A024B2X2_9CAUD|nr:hypothetical protein FP73_gp036 [Bacillus phage Hoody T]AHZ10348.1 hypothetical protein [Bacillus phage Hoody T]
MEFGETFFTKLKEFILEDCFSNLDTLIPHYENLLDYADTVSTMLVDVEENGVYFRYERPDTPYTDGVIVVYIHHTKRRYEIKLLKDDRPWGYCSCQQGDEGYNPDKGCCGDGCDWIAPRFEVELVTSMAYGAYKGQERDLWKDEEKWKKYTKDHRAKDIEGKINASKEYENFYKSQAEHWQRELDKLQKEECDA